MVPGRLQANLTVPQVEALQSELADIDQATSTVPMRNSDLYFMLRYHLNQTRSRLAEASEAAWVRALTHNSCHALHGSGMAIKHLTPARATT